MIAFIASAAVTGVRGSFGNRLTGDEPEYMLTAISLAEDADLNIADEHAAKRYRPFHQSRLPAQALKKPGPVMVSPHDPLLSALLAVPVAAGGWIGAKLFMAATAAILAAATLWTAVVRFKAPLGAASVVTGLFAASAPLAVYGSQVYPEIPAALAVVVGVAAVSGPLGTRGLFALAASVLALPWLGIKYTPVAAVLAALALYRLARGGRVAAGVKLAGVLLIAGLTYAAAHQAWYGGWTVYASGEHFAEAGEFSAVGKAPNLAARSTRLAGLLIDRRFGLVPWQPAWVLAPAALVALIRRRADDWQALILPLAAGWLFAVFAAVTMHGWWWPGRHALVVLPLAVIA
ncbi:MAG: hypothetical protein ACRDIU_09000, partial [Actinomycetota bacterium]